jgi:site-specific recombinase XerD
MRNEWLNSFHRYLVRRNVSSYTVRNYLHAVVDFLQSVSQAPQDVTFVDVAKYVERLQAGELAAKTINCRLSAVRQFYDYLHYDHLPGLLNPVRKRDFLREPRPLPRTAREEELVCLFGQIRSVRDRAIFLVLLRSGLRVAEVVGLELKDVDLRRQTLQVREAKNRRERLVYLSPDTVRVLEEYFEQRGWPKEGKVFVGEKGPRQGQSLSIRGVQKRIEGYARRVGVPISCHVLRHSLAMHLLNQGVRLVVVQELLGHARVTSTQRYARLANRQVREEYFKGMEKVLRKVA